MRLPPPSSPIDWNTCTRTRVSEGNHAKTITRVQHANATTNRGAKLAGIVEEGLQRRHASRRRRWRWEVKGTMSTPTDATPFTR